MPKITAITKQSNNNYFVNIFLDGGYSFSVTLDSLMSNGLKVGVELSEKDIEKIKFSAENDKAAKKGLTYVSKSFKTKKQVKDYLISKGFSIQSVLFAIDKLTEFGYIDDVEYARRYIETYSSTQGKRLMEYKLMMKGIKKSDILAAEENFDFSSKENALKIAERRLFNKEITKELLSKTFRYLVGKGFSYEDAEYAISHFKENN